MPKRMRWVTSMSPLRVSTDAAPGGGLGAAGGLGVDPSCTRALAWRPATRRRRAEQERRCGRRAARGYTSTRRVDAIGCGACRNARHAVRLVCERRRRACARHQPQRIVAMPQLNPYLSFDGTCAQAMKYYERVLGAKLEALITYAQMPMGDQPVPASHADRIMHAYLVHPEFTLMAGDAPPGVPYAGIQGVMLTLTYATADEARRVFNAFADGGKVNMPLGETFWAETFGMVVDRFGTPWGINGGMKPRAQG
jgi:PhnB protein